MSVNWFTEEFFSLSCLNCVLSLPPRYDFNNVTRVVVDSPEPTFGLCVMDVMGLTASVPKDQINNLINMQTRLVREELLCPNPNAIGVICHGM